LAIFLSVLALSGIAVFGKNELDTAQSSEKAVVKELIYFNCVEENVQELATLAALTGFQIALIPPDAAGTKLKFVVLPSGKVLYIDKLPMVIPFAPNAPVVGDEYLNAILIGSEDEVTKSLISASLEL
jgi:hypothetical protein